MKKTLLMAILCLVALLGVALCGCNGHKHTFSDKWASDETHHWHPATCEHETERDKEAEHTFGSDGKCTVCGKERQHVHENLTFVPEVQATCTQSGTKAHYKCSCGKLFDKETDGEELESSDLTIPAKGHGDFSYHEAVTATCVTEGALEYYECGFCGSKFDSDDKGNPLSDDEINLGKAKDNHVSPLDEVPSSPATCVAEGNYKYYKCPDCGEKYEDDKGKNPLTDAEIIIPVDRNAHIVKEFDFVPSVPATCDQSGLDAHYECPGCGMMFADAEGLNELSENQVKIAELGHAYVGEAMVSDGKQGHHRVCHRCHEAEKDESGDVVILEHEVTAYGVCITCGEDLNHEHSLVFHSAVLATCEEGTTDDPDKGLGYEAYYECTECEKKFADKFGSVEIDEVQVTPRKEHDYVVECTKEEHWLVCHSCGKEAENSRGKHVYEGGVCISDSRVGEEDFGYWDEFANGCGYSEFIEQDGLYFAEDGGKYYVKSLVKDYDHTDIVIPASIKVSGTDKEVEGIWSDAFDGTDIVYSLVLPKTIKEIKKDVFDEVYIAYIYFDGSKNDWDNVTVEENNGDLKNNVYFKSDNEPTSTDYDLYYHMVGDKRVAWERNIDPSLKAVTVDGVCYEKTDKGEWQVTDLVHNYLAALPMPRIIRVEEKLGGKNVTSTGSQCFDDLEYVYSLILPTSINSIATFTFDEDFIDYVYYLGGVEDWNGITKDDSKLGLYDKTKLCYYASTNPHKLATEGRFWYYRDGVPALWSPKMPDSATGGVKLELGSDDTYTVTGVESSQFTTVIIPSKHDGKDVTKISNTAFNLGSAGALEAIVIPTSIKVLESGYSYSAGGYVYPFSEQTATIYYEGASDEWKEIDGADDATIDDETYGRSVFCFLEEQPEAKGRYWKFGEDKTIEVWKETSDGEEIPDEIVEIDAIRYLLSPNMDAYYVAACLDNVMDLAKIVSSIGELPVTRVKDNAFANYAFDEKFTGTKIVIPESITELGRGFSDVVTTIFYEGETIDEFQKIGNVSNCGLSLKNVYLYTEIDNPGAGKFWKYDNNGNPYIIKVAVSEKRHRDGSLIYAYDSESGTATVVDFVLGSDPIVRIPDTVRIDDVEYTVKAIGEAAFINAAGITGLVISDNVETIGNRAFYGIGTLEWVVFGCGLNYIGEGAFYYFEQGYEPEYYTVMATAFTVENADPESEGDVDKPKGIIYYHGDSDSWDNLANWSAFPDWYGGSSYYYHGLESDGYDTGLLKVYFSLGDGEKAPEFGAEKYWYFDGNQMPMNYADENIIRIDHVYYKYDPATKEATVVAGEHIDTSAHDYCVVDKFTLGKTVYDVVAIADRAFYYDYSNRTQVALRSIVLPDSIKKIGENAFYGQDMESLVLGTKITEIGEGAFELDSYYDVNIYYRGENEASYTGSKLSEALSDSIFVIYYYSANRPKSNVTAYWHFVDDMQTQPAVYIWGQEWTDKLNGVAYLYYESDDEEERYAEVVGYIGKAEDAVLVVLPSITVGGVNYPVTKIAAKAFEADIGESGDNIVRFKAVILPDSITEIGDSTFYGQTELEYIVLGTGIEKIGDYSFNFVPISAKLFFRGDEDELAEFVAHAEEWDSASYYGIGSLLSLARYIFSSEEPEESGNYWHFVGDDESAAAPWHEEIYSDPDGLKFSYNSASKEAVLIGGIVAGALRIPEYIEIGNEKYTVVEVGAGAFATTADASGSPLTSIEIPKTVKKLGAQAFYYQQNIAYILLHGEIEAGDEAFMNVGAYQNSIKIYFLGDEEEYKEFAAKNVLPSTITNKQKVYLQYTDELTESDKYGLWKYDDDGKIVEVLDFPFGTVTVDSLTFEYNTRGKYATLISAPKNYYSPDTLKVPSEVKVGETSYPVTAIGDRAFDTCYSKVIILPDSITTIGEAIFTDCYYIEAVVIGKGITSVANGGFTTSFGEKYGYFRYNAFSGKVYFHGNEDEYKAFKAVLDKIPVDPGKSGSGLENLTDNNLYYYSDESKEGNYWHYQDEDETVPVKWVK